MKNCTKRLKRPRVLTLEEFYKLLPFLEEPYRTMVITAQCLGLRVNEIVALRWSDFDFEKLTLLVQRSTVKARVDEVKTEYSRDDVPLHPDLAHILLEWRERAPFRKDADWVFGSPKTGKPYYQEHIQQAHLPGRRSGPWAKGERPFLARDESAAWPMTQHQDSPPVADKCPRSGDSCQLKDPPEFFYEGLVEHLEHCKVCDILRWVVSVMSHCRCKRQRTGARSITVSRVAQRSGSSATGQSPRIGR